MLSGGDSGGEPSLHFTGTWELSSVVAGSLADAKANGIEMCSWKT
jgi:hypothetical protein